MFLTLRPEAAPINYVSRVKIPTPDPKREIRYSSSRKTIQPMYDLLGTPASDK
jgi:hypothetical protein